MDRTWLLQAFHKSSGCLRPRPGRRQLGHASSMVPSVPTSLPGLRVRKVGECSLNSNQSSLNVEEVGRQATALTFP